MLIYYVGENGEIEKYRLNRNRSGAQLVHVIFENNQADFESTTGWLADVLASMKYDRVNLVAHFMGGIVSLKFALQYQSESFPEVNKFVALGAPFGGVFSQEYFQIHHDAAEGLQPESAGFQLLATEESNESIEVLNLGISGEPVAVVESVQTLDIFIPEEQIR